MLKQDIRGSRYPRGEERCYLPDNYATVSTELISIGIAIPAPVVPPFRFDERTVGD
jgi:hypothetical protein